MPSRPGSSHCRQGRLDHLEHGGLVVAANHDLCFPEPERILLEMLHNVPVLVDFLARYSVRAELRLSCLAIAVAPPCPMRPEVLQLCWQMAVLDPVDAAMHQVCGAPRVCRYGACGPATTLPQAVHPAPAHRNSVTCWPLPYFMVARAWGRPRCRGRHRRAGCRPAVPHMWHLGGVRCV